MPNEIVHPFNKDVPELLTCINYMLAKIATSLNTAKMVTDMTVTNASTVDETDQLVVYIKLGHLTLRPGSDPQKNLWVIERASFTLPSAANCYTGDMDIDICGGTTDKWKAARSLVETYLVDLAQLAWDNYAEMRAAEDALKEHDKMMKEREDYPLR